MVAWEDWEKGFLGLQSAQFGECSHSVNSFNPYLFEGSMSRIITMRVKLGEPLAEKVEQLANSEGTTVNQWLVEAVETKIRETELNELRMEIALQEINREVLSGGQELKAFSFDDMLADGSDVCQMCLKEIVMIPGGVDGPSFCTNCLEIAKGADFSNIET